MNGMRATGCVAGSRGLPQSLNGVPVSGARAVSLKKLAVIPAQKAGDPVRRGFSVQLLTSLEYRIARFRGR
jgi:hypothetical protein